MKQVLPGIVRGLLVLAGIAVLPAIWKGTSPFLQEDGTAGLGWFWGERIRRGLRRGVAAANLACGGLAVALIALGLGDGKAGPVVWLAVRVALGGLLLLAMIVLVNRLKVLVPPTLRDEPGALSRRSHPRLKLPGRLVPVLDAVADPALHQDRQVGQHVGGSQLVDRFLDQPLDVVGAQVAQPGSHGLDDLEAGIRLLDAGVDGHAPHWSTHRQDAPSPSRRP
jgi:hypothetical protein